MDRSDPVETQNIESPPDAMLENCRRELRWILAMWLACFLWVIGYCWLFGYDRGEEQEIAIVLGMPSWIVWGICLPWVVAATVSSCFALWGIANDPLGEDPGPHTNTPEDPQGETDHV